MCGSCKSNKSLKQCLRHQLLEGFKMVENDTCNQQMTNEKEMRQADQYIYSYAWKGPSCPTHPSQVGFASLRDPRDRNSLDGNMEENILARDAQIMKTTFSQHDLILLIALNADRKEKNIGHTLLNITSVER